MHIIIYIDLFYIAFVTTKNKTYRFVDITKMRNKIFASKTIDFSLISAKDKS